MTDDQFRVEHHERISRLENRVDHIDETLADVCSDVRVLHTELQANTATTDRKSTRLNSSHLKLSRMPSSA